MTDMLTDSQATDTAAADAPRSPLARMHLFSAPTATDPYAELADRIVEQVHVAADASATAARALLGR